MIFTNGDGPLQKQFSADEFCEDAMNITSFNLKCICNVCCKCKHYVKY